MRRIEPFLASSFQRSVGRNKRSIFEDADLVGENVDLDGASPRGVGHAIEIAADADHAVMEDPPLESQHRPEGAVGRAFNAAVPRRRPR